MWSITLFGTGSSSMDNEYEGYLYAANLDVRQVRDNIGLGLSDRLEMTAYHTQQAAEKMLKSVIAEHTDELFVTHKIDHLLSVARDRGWLSFSDELIQKGSFLSNFATSTRYATSKDISEGEVLEAIRDHDEIVRMIIENGYQAIPIHVGEAIEGSAFP